MSSTQSAHNSQTPFILNTLCPHCHHQISATPTVNHDISYTDTKNIFGNPEAKHKRFSYWHGLRRCTNPECGHLFFFTIQQDQHDNQNIQTIIHPPILKRINTVDIPEKLAHLLHEAIRCNSNNCYIASAIMVRRTLEELCDEQSCTGKNLHDRIENLGSKVIISKALLEACHEIRILGNDAAHVSAKDYKDLNAEMIDTLLDLTIELLKAVYQHKDLLGKLKGFSIVKKTP